MTRQLSAAAVAIGFLLPGGLLAQNKTGVNIAWGDPVTLPAKHDRFGFTGDPEQGFLQVTKSKDELAFFRFSDKLKLEDSKMETLTQSKSAVVEGVLQIDGRAYALVSDFDKAAQAEKLRVWEIDIKNKGFKGEAKELISTTGEVTKDMISADSYQFTSTDKFKFAVPDKGDRLLVYYRMAPEKKKDSKNYDKIVYHLFDRNWKPVWNKEVTMPYTEADMEIIAHRLVNDDVYLFTRTRSGQTDPDTKKAEFDGLSVLRINGEGQTEEYPLEFGDSNLYDITIGDADGGNMLIAGYAKSRSRSFTYTGYATAIFNPKSFKLENIHSYTFGEGLIKAFESERAKRNLDKSVAKGKEPGIQDLELRRVIRRPGGGWYLVGEQYYHYTVTVQTDRSSRIVENYLYMDMVVSAVDKDGKEAFTVKVPKHQHLVDMMYGDGISAFEYNDNLYLFYLDHVKNKTLTESQTPVTYTYLKDATLMCVKITPAGNMERLPLFDVDVKDQAKFILPTGIEQVKPGVLLSASRRDSYWINSKTNTPALIYLN